MGTEVLSGQLLVLPLMARAEVIFGEVFEVTPVLTGQRSVLATTRGKQDRW